MKKNNINYLVTSFLLPFILSLQLYYNVFIRNKNTNKFIKLLTILGCVYLFYRINGYSISLCDNKLSSPIWGTTEIKIGDFILFATNKDLSLLEEAQHFSCWRNDSLFNPQSSIYLK